MSAAPSATEQRKRGTKSSPSGRLLLRMPAALHAELARWAEREGVSLNQFITRSLEGRIGWGEEIRISQGAEVGRPSTLHARVDGSADAIERVEVGGSAVVVARGEFRL